MNYSYARLPAFLALAILISGCATPSKLERVTEAAQKTVQAESTVKVVEVVKQTPAPPLPPLPERCRQHVKTGIVDSDRADIALTKADAAVGRANNQTDLCAGWYDNIKGSKQ